MCSCNQKDLGIKLVTSAEQDAGTQALPSGINSWTPAMYTNVTIIGSTRLILQSLAVSEKKRHLVQQHWRKSPREDSHWSRMVI